MVGRRGLEIEGQTTDGIRQRAAGSEHSEYRGLRSEVGGQPAASLSVIGY